MPYTLSDVMQMELRDYLKRDLPDELAAGSESVDALTTRIEVGWSSQAEDAVLPIVGLDTPVTGERIGRAPVSIQDTQPAQETDPSITSLIAVAAVSQPIICNVWARSKEERSIIMQALDVALQGEVVNGSSLIRINAARYFGLPITFYREGTPEFQDSIQGVGGEEWRATFTVIGEAHEVVAYAGTRIIDLSVYLEMAFRVQGLTYQGTRKIFEPS